MTTTPEWDARFEAILRDALPLVSDLGAQTCLRAAGLDSLATIDVLMRLEDAYGVSIPDALLTADTFATPAALWSTIASVRGSATAPTLPVGGR